MTFSEDDTIFLSPRVRELSSEKLRSLINQGEKELAQLLNLVDEEVSYHDDPVGQQVRTVEEAIKFLKLEAIRRGIGLIAEVPQEGKESQSEKQETTVTENTKASAMRSPRSSKTGTERNEDVAKRRTLVKNNLNISAAEMCGIFDRKSIPLPPKLLDAGLRSWGQAYRDPQFRKRIHVLISKDRHSD